MKRIIWNSKNQWDEKDRSSNDAVFDAWTESSRVSGAVQTTEHYTLNLFVLFSLKGNNDMSIEFYQALQASDK